jgi:hypothetical protein
MATPNVPYHQQSSQVPGFNPPPRRLAVIDIETVSIDPADDRGALDAMSGRIVCIGILFDDGQKIELAPIADLDETALLTRFWQTIRDTDLLIGHNILGFDLMFIRQRSWILGIKPPIAVNIRKYYTDQVVDLMELWTNWSNKFKGASLENIAWALGCGEKTGHGSDVATMWASGQYAAMMDYCMNDVWLTYRIYCRMHYRQALPAPMRQFEPRDTRELVPVRSQSSFLPVPATMPAAAAQAGFRECIATSLAPAPAPTPATTQPQARTRRSPRRGRERAPRVVTYRAQGNSVFVSGDTFPFRQTFKEIFRARGHKNGETFEWEMEPQHLPALAGMLANSGVQLTPAGA